MLCFDLKFDWYNLILSPTSKSDNNRKNKPHFAGSDKVREIGNFYFNFRSSKIYPLKVFMTLVGWVCPGETSKYGTLFRIIPACKVIPANVCVRDIQ